MKLALPTLVLATLSVALVAQEPNPEVESTTAPAAANDAQQPESTRLVDRPQKMEWPRDRQRPICKVGGRTYVLEDLISHLDRRHYPGMLELMETPGGRGYLQHPLMADWVRQFADATALEAEAKLRGSDLDDARAVLGDSLRFGFEQWLAQYQQDREKQGNPIELTQQRVDLLLTNYQRDHGLETEVRGWLGYLVPPVGEDDERLHQFYNDHPQIFGGVVTVNQILIENRDPNTLELKTGEAREQAYAKLADVQARLEPDGSNFADVARLLSDDRRTAKNGGRMQGIRRFDPRLPAVLCRTSWQLRDGQISDPIQSRYGIHIIQRVGYKHRYYVIYNKQIHGKIAATMRQKMQEDALFQSRRTQGVVLYY